MSLIHEIDYGTPLSKSEKMVDSGTSFLRFIGVTRTGTPFW